MPENPLSTMEMSSTLATADVLWFCLYAATFLFTLHAVVVAYHWYTFGTDKKLSTIGVGIYTGVGAALLLVALGFITFSG